MTDKLCEGHEETCIQLLSDFTVRPGAAEMPLFAALQATIAFWLGSRACETLVTLGIVSYRRRATAARIRELRHHFTAYR